MTRKLYQHLASAIQAQLNCRTHGNPEWAARHEDAIVYMAKECLPSGGGIDNGVHVDLDRSTGDKIVLAFGYHHMDDGGCYDGWTEHMCIVTGDLQSEIALEITGRNRNDIKDYLYEVFSDALRTGYVHTYDKLTDTAAYTRLQEVSAYA